MSIPAHLQFVFNLQLDPAISTTLTAASSKTPNKRSAHATTNNDAPRPIEHLSFPTEGAAADWLAGLFTVSDWKIKKNRHEVAHKKRVAANEEKSGCGGRPKIYDYTEIYECRCAGTYKLQHCTYVPSESRRPHRSHGTALTGCKARITFRRRVGHTSIEVEHDTGHNHEVGTMKAMADNMLPKRTTKWIAEQVEKGTDSWAAFKKLL
ncbi:hypothetical protein PENSPDRAFT_694958 [Peniophora sp. CONT]|nr:hypothetical protein PENSPDRAFT_694958 [Peniophora sp. CONT]